MATTEEPIHIEGFLDKLGEKGITGKKYQRRYFKLIGTSQLHYYKQQKDALNKPKNSKGFIDLKRAMLIEPVLEDAAGSRNSVNKRASMTMINGVRFIIKTPERIYDLVAASQKDMLNWVSTLNEVLSRIKSKRIEANNARQSALPGTSKISSSYSDMNFKRFSEIPSSPKSSSPNFHTVSSGNLSKNSNNTKPSDPRISTFSGTSGNRSSSESLERKSSPNIVSSSQNQNSKDFSTHSQQSLNSPQRQSSSTPTRESKFDLNDIVCLVERVSSREWKESHQTLNKELEKALLQFREMKAIKNREESEKLEVAQHIAAFTQLRSYSEKEIESIDGLSNSINIVKKNSNQRQDIVHQAEKIYRIIESLISQISSENRIYLDIVDKLEHLNKKLAAPSFLSHHQHNVENLSKEMEELPEKLAVLEKQIQQNETEITRLTNEKSAFFSLKMKIPDEIRKINNRSHIINERLQQLRNSLRDLVEEKAKLDQQYQEHQKKKSVLVKQENSLNLFKKILNEPSWNEMLSTFSIVANLEQQANSLIAELGDSNDSNSSVATVDIDKKESLDQKAKILEEKYEFEKNEFNRVNNQLLEEIEEKDKVIRDMMKDISNLENELQTIGSEKVTLQNQLDDLSKKLTDNENSKVSIEMEQEKLFDRKRDLNYQFDEKQKRLEEERRKFREESQKRAELDSEINSQTQLKYSSFEKLCDLYSDTKTQIDLLDNLLKLEKQLSTTILVGIEEQSSIRSQRLSIIKEKILLINQVRNDCLKHNELSSVSVSSSSPTINNKEINETLEITELLSRLSAAEANLEQSRTTERDLREQMISQKAKEKELKEQLFSFQLKERDFHHQISSLQSNLSSRSIDDDKIFHLQQKIIEQKSEIDRLCANVSDWQAKAEASEKDLADSIRLNSLLSSDSNNSNNLHNYNAPQSSSTYDYYNDYANNDPWSTSNSSNNNNNHNHNHNNNWGDYGAVNYNNNRSQVDERLTALQQEIQKLRVENLSFRQKAQLTDSYEAQLKDVQSQFNSFQVYHQETVNRLESQRPSSSSQPLYSQQQLQLAAQELAQEIAQEMSQKLTQTAVNEERDKWENEKKEKEEVFIQRISQLKTEIQELRTVNETMKNTILLYEKKIASLEEKMSISSLKSIENSLREKEGELAQIKQKYQSLESEFFIIESNLKSLNLKNQQNQDELSAKNNIIFQLQQQAKSQPADRKNQNSQAKKTPINDLQREITRLNTANYAHQLQNSQLESLITDLKDQIKSISAAKDQELANLRIQLNTLQSDYQNLRLQSLINSGCDEKTLKDIESINWLKKEYFFSLAVGIKLELSKEIPCNLDIFDLYEEAFSVPVPEWHKWLTKRFYEYQTTEKKKTVPSSVRKNANAGNNSRNVKSQRNTVKF